MMPPLAAFLPALLALSQRESATLTFKQAG